MFWWKEEVVPGIWAGFTDAGAGNLALHVNDDPSAVRLNRARLEQEMGIEPGSLRFMNQVHSPDVAVVGRGAAAGPVPEPVPEADAMVSPGGRTPLAVMVADCVPVVFAGTAADGSVLTAVAHAGRQGLLAGVVGNTVAELRSGGAVALRAWIGPSVCGRCYEVPALMRREAAAELPAVASTTAWGTPALDLPAGVADLLAVLGVAAEAVPGCTLEEERLFSYRRDRQTGRFAGLVWRQP